MKLHLPIGLLTLVIAPALYAVDYEVGTHTGGNNLPSAENNYTVYEDVTLNTGDRMGTFKDGKLLTDADFGKEEWASKNTIGKELVQKSAGNVTKNVHVTGTLSLTGDAQVSLGGQYKTPTTYIGWGDLGGYLDSADEFTGLIATNVEVNDTAKLSTWNAIADNITVNGGTVNIHTYRAEGNMGYRLGMPTDSKQVQIKQTLTVKDGTVTIGHGQYNNHTNTENSSTAATQNPETDYHTVTAFGSYIYEGTPTISDGKLSGVTSADRDPSLISQSGGKLTVAGKSLSVGGLNIDQTGGTMSISVGGKHFIADYGDSDIKQNSLDADTSMTIGAIKAFNTYYSNIKASLKENPEVGAVDMDPTIKLTHSGAGKINLNGVDFTPEIGAAVEHSTITQNDYVDAETGKVTTTTGAINLNGEYKGVTFDISQTGGGNINLNADIQAGAVKQSGTGTITVASGKTLNAESIEISSGTLVNNGTVNVASSEPAMLLAAGDDVTTLDNTEDMMNITITGGQVKNYGVLNGDISVQGGVLELLAGNVGDITMTAGEIIVQSNSTTGNLTLNGGTITFAEGAVLTLSGDSTVALNGANVIVQVSADTLAGLEQGSNVTLFDVGTDTLDFNNTVVTFVNGEDSVQAIVSGAAADSANGGQVIVNAVIPEPTTATLSLLALAALAARRRRR